MATRSWRSGFPAGPWWRRSSTSSATGGSTAGFAVAPPRWPSSGGGPAHGGSRQARGDRLDRRDDVAPKYIFVTGGVVSSLGKGLASAAIGALLEARGFRVAL